MNKSTIADTGMCLCALVRLQALLLLLPILLGSDVRGQGQVDGSWTVPSNPDWALSTSIDAIALQPDGKVIVAGGFTTFWQQPRMRIARLNPNGTLDSTFDPGAGPSGPIYDVLVRPDGKILVAGNFSFFSGASANGIALLNPDGSLNDDFNTAGAFYDQSSQGIHNPGVIYDIALDPLGRILLCGYFNRVQGHSTVGVARLQSNGNVDEGFATPYFWNAPPQTICGGNDFDVLVAGFFTEVDEETHNRLIRFNYDGTIDDTFNPFGGGVDENNPAIESEIFQVVVRPDGKTWISGDFLTYNGTSRPNIALLGTDGTLDNSFSGGSGPDGKVKAFAFDDNEDIIVAGAFSHVHGHARPGLARMFTFGGLDLNFVPPGPLLNFRQMLLQPDGKILAITLGNGSDEVRRFCPAVITSWFADADADGYGDPDNWVASCGHPEGYVSDSADDCPTIHGLQGDPCDDGDPATLSDHIRPNCVCLGYQPVSSFPWQEDFFGGNGGFTFINGTYNNWYHGSATGNAAPALYASSSPTQTNYTFFQPAVSHAIRELQWPESISDLKLEFDRIGMGVPGSDYLKVWLVPSSFTPVAGQAITADGSGYSARIDLTGELTGASTWVHHSYTLPSSYVGHNVRLVFEWQNDASGGLSPGAGIDNISVCPMWYGDADADGFGDPAFPTATCNTSVPGSVTNNLDDCPAVVGRSNILCDDGSPSTLNDMIDLDCVCRGAGFPWNYDFSNGMGGFTDLSAGQTNKWYWIEEAGSWSISGAGTLDRQLGIGPASASHLIHDVPLIPANASTIQLNFIRDHHGGNAAHKLRVWLVPPSYTPVAGTPITASGIAPGGRVLLGEYLPLFLGPAPTNLLINLPVAYAGTSPRLVFEWVDDGSFNGSQVTVQGSALFEIHLCAKGPGFGDADADGTLDCMDECPNLSVPIPSPCDDGDPETVNDMYDHDCVCKGYTVFTEGRLVVMQVGGLDDNSINNGKPLTLREITTSGSSGATVEIPYEGSDPLITNNNYTKGMLGLSADSTKLIFAGYMAPRNPNGDPDPLSSWSAPRKIAQVGAGGIYQNLATSPALFDGMVIRGAAASGNDAWGLGNGEGLNYFGAGPAADVTDAKSDFRYATIFNGQLYVSSASSEGDPPHAGVFAVGSGTPTTSGQTLTTVVNTDHIGTAAFCFSPDGNTLYVALNITGIQKWVNSGTWELDYTLTFDGGANGLVADFTQGPPVLYFTTTSGDKVMKVTDPGSGSGSVPVSPTLVRNAWGNSVLRGLSWAPKHVCVEQTFYADNEGDGFGDPASSINWCGAPPPGYVADNTDNCLLMAGKVGSSCDDGSIHTNNDVLLADCTCQGTWCPVPVFEASSGTQNVCSGSSMGLTSPPAWGSNGIMQSGYTWTGPGTIYSANATVYNSATVSPTPPPGEYVHRRTATNACGSSTYQLITTVLPVVSTVTPSGTVHACASTGVTLTASPGIYYSWYRNNIDLNHHQGSIWVNTDGAYFVRVVNSNNCQLDSPPTQVVIDAAPTITCGSYGPLCNNGPNINLGGSPAGGVWTGVGVIGPNAQGIYRFTPGVGTRTLTYTYTANGCPASCTTTINVQQSATWYADVDGDGYGDPAVSSQECGYPGIAWTTDSTDDCPGVFGKVGSTCDDGNSSTIADVLSASCVCQGVYPTLAARVFLQGPYSSGAGLMNDALRTLPGFPLTQPYTALGYSGGLNETGPISPPVLSVSGNDAIVDWVVVELRSPASPATIVDQCAVLVQRDGDIVALDGVSPVTFPGASGSYHVAIRHRNHLGCMTNATVSFGATPLSIDFTDPALVTWGTNARLQVGSVMVLYMGDGNANGQVKYTGNGNDRDPILITVGSTTPNNAVINYSGPDINMNGQVKYTGNGNDRDPVLINVGSTTPNNTRTQQLP